jgi:hypothetical protein
MRLTKRLDLRASNKDLGFGSGRNLDSLKVIPGKAKPLRRSLPNAWIFISNLLYLVLRKTLDFLRFWGLS